jgi:outer membrane protein assembly factor BamB
VYAVGLTDGALVWRFTAAPAQRKAMLHGRLSSAFPVHGGVSVLGGRLMATAGFHSDLGGIHVWSLEPATGAILAKQTYRGGGDGKLPAVNDILSATADGTSTWLFRDAGFTPAGEVLQGKGRAPGRILRPVVALDRNGAFVRFPHDYRGGSTHGWKGAMAAGTFQKHRVCVADGVAYGLIDPRVSDIHPVRAAQTVVLSAVRGDPKNVVWTASGDALGRKESYGALIKAGNRLFAGGGSRDGSKGFVQVVSAADGKLIAEYAMPARVAECGLAVAGGRLYVSCEDGSVVCLGAGK